MNSSRDQFTLSLELLHLMQWIVENDHDGLKRLIMRALTHGFHNNKHTPQDESAESPHHSIIEFFLLMEALLAETINEINVKNALQKNLMPAVHRIDATAFDIHTVRHSLEQAAHHIQKNPQENPRELLLKELIKNWKPTKKNMTN